MSSKKLKELYDLLNLEKFVFIDIGAAGGFDQKWSMLGDRLSVIGFEPSEEEFRNLTDAKKRKNVTYYNYCLAEKPCRLKFFVAPNNKNASCLRLDPEFFNRFPFSERFDSLREVFMDANSLDNTPLADKADFIKIDTDGYELNILKGGAKVLDNVCGLEVEVGFSELYKEQPLFADVDSYLRGAGFSLFDLRPAYWKRNLRHQKGRGQIIFADAIYFKDYIGANSVPTHIGPPIIASVAYKKYDFATELVSYFCQKGRLSCEKKKRIESIIAGLSKPVLKIPAFKGRGRIISYLQGILRAFKSVDWARKDSWE